MCFAETLERLKLGRPIVDIYEYINERIEKEFITYRRRITKVRLHPKWHHELIKELNLSTQYHVISFTTGTQMGINTVFGLIDVIPDINVPFIDFI